jgi:enoyl-CoA hydratase/carnithine racemase
MLVSMPTNTANPPLTMLPWKDLLAMALAAEAGANATFGESVLLDLRGCGLAGNDVPTVRQWLMRQPCPIIALAEEREQHALVAACDTRVSSESEAAATSAYVQQNPLAATVLVQLLRAAESLPIESALTLESLAYSTLQAGPEFKRWLDANRAEAPAAHTDTGPAVLMDREGDQLSLVLNRASNRNGMTVEMRDALLEALQLVLADDSISPVSLSGKGKCFSTGGDLTEFGTAPDPVTAHMVRSVALPGRLLARCAERVKVKVHGACVGSGIEFPAFAGHITAAADAYFQLPELKFGLIPGAGGTVSIARRIGRQRTAWLVLTGKRIKAEQALQWGLVDALA